MSLLLENKAQAPSHQARTWSPKFWYGGNLAGWTKMLIHNRFAVDLRYLHEAVLITVTALLNSTCRGVEEAIWGGRIRRTEIIQPPLFVIGHWRSGTTLLHELLALDPRFTYPNTYECMNPNHFLLTEWFDTVLFPVLYRMLLPERRPFDNVAVGWERPQEDEFALCNLGLPSPYQKLAFPNRTPHEAYLSLEALSPRKLRHWQRGFLLFLKHLTLRNPKRIVLKSPTHTYRIKVLLDLFPTAQFVHIVRNPYTVYASTMHMWKTIFAVQGLQRPRFDGLEEHVFDCFLKMHDKLDEARPLLGSSCFHELRYEDLVRDPIGQLQVLYDQLDLKGFEPVVAKVQHYLKETSGYQTNQFDLTPELKARIRQHWAPIIDRYGY